MTKEEAINRLKNMAWIYGSVEREQNIEAIDMAISALSEKTETLTHEEAWAEIEASDLISRADAIEAVENNSYGMGSRASVKAIKALPSADRPHGEWQQEYRKTANGVDFCVIACSECDYYDAQMHYYNYCPSCGARMENDINP